MAKAPKSTRKAYIALRTIQRGSPKNIETIHPGEEIDLTESEAKDFVERGIVREEDVASAPVPNADPK